MGAHLMVVANRLNLVSSVRVIAARAPARHISISMRLTVIGCMKWSFVRLVTPM